MVNHPILALAERLDERAMAYSPNLGRLLEHRPMFGPSSWIQHLIGLVVQKAEAIVRRPTAAGGIHNKNIAVAFQHLRSFTNRHRDPFPRLVRSGDQDAFSANPGRIFQWSDVNVLLSVLFACPA